MHGSYLQGMETKCNKSRSPSCALRTDPTYKEWKLIAIIMRLIMAPPCTDPTYKEWKRLLGFVIVPANMSTDPTYKEWKPAPASEWPHTDGGHGSYLQGMETVRYCLLEFLEGEMHGSYLQGMETRGTSSQSPNRRSARILPTRNGNAERANRQRKWHPSTDPTYKEWKPKCICQVDIAPFISTDPTYKEWKLFLRP